MNKGKASNHDVDDLPNRTIELKVEYRHLNSFFADYAKNIRRGSTFIQTDRPLPVGTHFLFQLVTPDARVPLALRGRVDRHVQHTTDGAPAPLGMIIGFLFNSETERLELERYVRTLMAGSLGPQLSDKLLSHGHNV